MTRKNGKDYNAGKTVFTSSGGFARTATIAKSGISSAGVARLSRDGAIVRVKRGLYRWHDADPSSNIVEATRIVPSGVVCLLSALAVHELGTKTPWEVHLAIHFKARKPVMPDYPPIRLAYFSDVQYQTGIMTMKFDGVPVSVYDPEKTLCDCARYRNKIGQDVFREAMEAYLRRPGRDIGKLLDYAKKLRVWSIVRPMTEALA